MAKKKNKAAVPTGKVEIKKGIKTEYIILAVSAIFMMIFVMLAFLSYIGSLGVSVEPLDFVVIGALILIGPFGFYKSNELGKIKQIERRLPEFLRDVAEAGRFGMTLADAIVVASSGRYGRLTPEIKKMAAQINWGVPAGEALRLFAQRVNTPLVNKVVAIIIKSNDAGGSVADVLGMVSHDTRETQLTEEERKIAMSTYIAVIYIAFFVFLVTIIILNATFLPKMQEAGAKIGESAEQGMISVPTLVQADYIPSIKTALIIAAVAHAIGDGILAGVLENGRVEYGLRHSFIMLVAGYTVLRLLG